jgi:hypothetical protein
MREAATLETLDASWSEAATAFEGAVPLEVEDSFNLAREAIIEREGKRYEQEDAKVAGR